MLHPPPAPAPDLMLLVLLLMMLLLLTPTVGGERSGAKRGGETGGGSEEGVPAALQAAASAAVARQGSSAHGPCSKHGLSLGNQRDGMEVIQTGLTISLVCIRQGAGDRRLQLLGAVRTPPPPAGTVNQHTNSGMFYMFYMSCVLT